MPNFTIEITQKFYDFINGIITAEQAGPDVVTLAQTLNPIFGTDAKDRLKGTTDADVLFGGVGQDFFFGGKGNDLIYTGASTDYVRAGAGDDTLLGEDGDDRLWGDNENDLIYGGIGDDRVYGGAHDDTLYGGEGNDIGIGGSGDDDLYGGAGKDVMRGGVGEDRLWGGDENDNLWGDQGKDRISGDEGDDKLYGGDSDDIISGGTGNDLIDGGNGNDIIITGSGNDSVYGGAGTDTINLNGGTNTVFGGTEADTFAYESGDAHLDDFEIGVDQLSIYGVAVNGETHGLNTSGALINLATGATVGNVTQDESLTITLATGTIVIAGTGIFDLGIEVIHDVVLPDGITNVIGTDADDTITGGHGDQAIYGGLGDDDFSGLHGNDYVFGGAGNDSFTSAINIKVETVRVFGGDGDDSFTHTTRSNEGDALAWFGGNGADIFEISDGYGDIVIHDFQAGVDALDFLGDWDKGDEFFAFEGNIYRDFRFAIDPSIGPVATYTTNANGDVVISYGDSITTSIGSSIDDLGLNANTVHGGDADADLGAANYINGGAGDEIITGTDDLDLLYGGAGNDVIVGGAGESVTTFYPNGIPSDIVRGDTIYGGDGDDIIYGDTHPDDTPVSGDRSLDVIYGGSGNDIIQGGAGNIDVSSRYQDHLFGGDGSDTFIVSNGNRSVVFDYQMGEDSVVIQGHALTADNFYATDAGDLIFIETGEVVGVVQVGSSAVNNSSLSQYEGTIRGFSADALFITSYADDAIAGSVDSEITLRGYGDIDDLNLARQSLSLVGSDGDDVLAGDGGTDQLFGLAGADHLSGGRSADQLFGGESDDTLFGEVGDDILSGDAGDDRLTGGLGNDTFVWNTDEGTDFITDFAVGEDIVTINGLALNGNNFQQTDGDLSLLGQSEVIGTVNESASGLSISLDGGGIVILGATILDLDIEPPDATLYGTDGADTFNFFLNAAEETVVIDDFTSGEDSIHLATGIDDDDYSFTGIETGGDIVSVFENPHFGDYVQFIGNVSYIGNNTVISMQGQPEITILGTAVPYSDIDIF